MLFFVPTLHSTKRQNRCARVNQTYGESGWVDDGVDHDDLLEEGGHGPERVPQHGSQVGEDLSLSTQFYEGVFSCAGASELLDPLEHLIYNTTDTLRLDCSVNSYDGHSK